MRRRFMNRTKLFRSFAVLGVIGSVAGCERFESSDGERNLRGSSVGGTSNGTAGGEGTEPEGCSAAKGGAMVQLSSPSGKPYCIDRTEVTQADYHQFLTANKGPTGNEHPACATNGSYVPVQDPPDSQEPKECEEGKSWTPTKTPSRPVACIDWCDAYAYCAWAGKRLCGRIGGGELTDPAPMIDPNESQWYNACSQGGKTDYPYGTEYDPGACEGKDTGATWLAKKDVAARVGCKGSEAPYNSIFDLSGSVMEFTDECESTGIPGDVACLARGGGYSTNQPLMACSVGANVDRSQVGKSYGFRCCKDL